MKSGNFGQKMPGKSGLAEDPAGELGLEPQRLLLGDLVELHGPLEIRLHSLQTGGGVGCGAEDDGCGHGSGWSLVPPFPRRPALSSRRGGG